MWKIARSNLPSFIALCFEGEEVFGSAKQPTNCPLNADNDFHCLNHVNFFCPQIKILVAQPHIVRKVGMQQPPCGSSACLSLVFRGGLELKEKICVDGQWQIEYCPPNFAV